MEILKTARSLRAWRAAQTGSLGFVPTMGALHEGHLSLVRASRGRDDRTVVSIYVNPTQFAPGEDLDAYPRTLDRDGDALRAEGVHALFLPDDGVMYPEGFATHVAVTGLTEGLCGASRPAHFRGVTTVVAKLFNLVRPDRAYFGQKDAQQAAVIRRMTRDLDLGVEVVVCPIVREADGLAMSSRNAYLSPEERQSATCLFEALEVARRLLEAGERSAAVLRDAMARTVVERGGPAVRLDYAEVVDPNTLAPRAAVEGEVLAALAVFFGPTRLIDNALMCPPS